MIGSRKSSESRRRGVFRPVDTNAELTEIEREGERREKKKKVQTRELPFVCASASCPRRPWNCDWHSTETLPSLRRDKAATLHLPGCSDWNHRTLSRSHLAHWNVVVSAWPLRMAPGPSSIGQCPGDTEMSVISLFLLHRGSFRSLPRDCANHRVERALSTFHAVALCRGEMHLDVPTAAWPHCQTDTGGFLGRGED